MANLHDQQQERCERIVNILAINLLTLASHFALDSDYVLDHLGKGTVLQSRFPCNVSICGRKRKCGQ